MANYLREIKGLKNDIEIGLHKMSFYHELDEVKQRMTKKYQEINSGYKGNPESKSYYVELSSLYEMELSYLMDLIKTKKMNESIYDDGNQEMKDKIQKLRSELEEKVTILGEKFPIIGKTALDDFQKAVAYYESQVEVSKKIKQREVYVNSGILEKEDGIVLGFGDLEELYEAYYRELNSINDSLNGEMLTIIENENIIKQIFDELYKDNEYKEKSNVINNEYNSRLEEIAKTHFVKSLTYNKIITLQKETLEKLNVLVEELKRKNKVREIKEYLSNINYESVNYNKLISLIGEIKSLDENEELLNELYQIMYKVLTDEKNNTKERFLSLLDDETKMHIEKILIDNLSKEQDEDKYQEYIASGFEKFILRDLEDTLENDDEIEENEASKLYDYARQAKAYINNDLDLGFYDETIEPSNRKLQGLQAYKYRSISPFYEGRAVVFNGNFGYIDKYGNEIVPCIYEDAYSFSEGLAAVKKDGKYGFINRFGREVIPCEYDFVSGFHRGRAIVQKNWSYGFIDKTGKEITPCKYSEVHSFTEDGLAKVEMYSRYGFIDEFGKEVVPCKYDSVESFEEGVARVELNGKYGLIDKTGKEIVPCEYDTIGEFKDGLARVRKTIDGINYYGVKYGFIDTRGKEVIPCKYDDARSFEEGLAYVKENNQAKFINTNGKVVISCKYDFIASFHEGMAYVMYNGGFGFIDKTGKEIVPCKYDNVNDFYEGFARVGMNNKYGFIDKTGKEIAPCKYENAFKFQEGLASVKKNGKYGFIDKTGREIIPCKYDSVSLFDNGYAIVSENGKWGVIDKTGEIVLDCDFDTIHRSEGNIFTAWRGLDAIIYHLDTGIVSKVQGNYPENNEQVQYEEASVRL